MHSRVALLTLQLSMATLCIDVNGFISSTILYGSVFSLCLISIDRLFAIAFVMKYRVNMKVEVSIKLVMLIWTLALIFSLPPLFGWSTYEYHSGTYHCSPRWEGWCSYYYLVFFLALVLPLSITCYSYVTIFRIVRGQRRKISHFRRSSGNLKNHDMDGIKMTKTSFYEENITYSGSSGEKSSKPQSEIAINNKHVFRKKSNSDSFISPPRFQVENQSKRHSIAFISSVATEVSLAGLNRDVLSSFDPKTMSYPNKESIPGDRLCRVRHGELGDKMCEVEVESIPLTYVAVAIVHSNGKNKTEKNDNKSNDTEKNGTLRQHICRHKTDNEETDSGSKGGFAFSYKEDDQTKRTVPYDDCTNEKTTPNSRPSLEYSDCHTNEEPVSHLLPGYCSDSMQTMEMVTENATSTKKCLGHDDKNQYYDERRDLLKDLSSKATFESEKGELNTTSNVDLQSRAESPLVKDVMGGTNEQFIASEKASVWQRLKSKQTRIKERISKTYSNKNGGLKRQISVNREFHVAKTGCLLVIIFILCYCPYAASHSCHTQSTQSQYRSQLSMWCVFLYSIISPLIFGFKDKDTRRNLLEGLRRFRRISVNNCC